MHRCEAPAAAVPFFPKLFHRVDQHAILHESWLHFHNSAKGFRKWVSLGSFSFSFSMYLARSQGNIKTKTHTQSKFQAGRMFVQLGCFFRAVHPASLHSIGFFPLVRAAVQAFEYTLAVNSQTGFGKGHIPKKKKVGYGFMLLLSV